MTISQRYPTDVTDYQWHDINNRVRPAWPGGHPRTLDMRQVINAIRPIVVGGIPYSQG